MDFEKHTFSTRLRELFFDSPMFPIMIGDYVSKWGQTQSDAQKHKDRNPTHLKQAAEQEVANTVVETDDTITFDYGSEKLERIYPYYHILQNSPVIRKAYKGTKKSKGAQIFQSIEQRDFERVHWNGKTFVKDYKKSVRGSRREYDTTKKIKGEYYNTHANQYLNVHYKYIDRILDSIVQDLASEFGLIFRRKQNTGLAEEYAMKEDMSLEDVLEAFYSFDE